MAITFEHVGYEYAAGTPMATPALHDVSFSIPDHSYLAIIGHTGSGKSTLIQHLNGLLTPTTGTVQIDEFQVTPTTAQKSLQTLRAHVGMVFQFPENQLFEETVVDDIAFGPQNFGVSADDAHQTALAMLATVGLDASVAQRSPFELSGGQMRRVAIAGVLAMKPKILVLDEPTAGLDPRGRREMMSLFKTLHDEQGLTIVLVTHQMEDAAQYADHIAVMKEGALAKFGSPREIFSDVNWLKNNHLNLPAATAFATRLQARGLSFSPMPLTEQELAQQLAARLKEAGSHV